MPAFLSVLTYIGRRATESTAYNPTLKLTGHWLFNVMLLTYANL